MRVIERRTDSRRQCGRRGVLGAHPPGLARRSDAWLKSPHEDAATLWWMQHVVLAEQCVRVFDDGRAVGFAALDGDWLVQLYVDPHHQGRGVGRALLEDAKRLRPHGLNLHVFTRNVRARRFYEMGGFVLIDQSDGRGNDELEPDCTYSWAPNTATP